MSFYTAPWNNNLEPSQGNVRQWLDNLYSKFQPIEQARWNQSNIDSLFYAGAQTFINRYFNYTPSSSYQNFYFNLLQQPVNMITGYQRQHRKGLQFVPNQGADPETTDQYSRLVSHVFNTEGIHEQFSRACEQACVTGMVLLQPYLDYTGDDHAQGQVKVKLWEYNSFLVDPYFRNYDMSDAQFVWCQEYISKKEADFRFPDAAQKIAPMSGSPQRYGSFYFLPENYNMARNDLLVLSYVWYKWKKKKKRLYSRSRNQFYDIATNNDQLELILDNITDMEEVEVEVPCWKLAVVLNDQLMFQGDNPLGFDGCPFIPVFWNYEPQLNYADLRCRGLVRTMRDSNYLLNRRIIINHDISEATINAGWKRKVGAVANEDNIKKTGQGWDVIINEGYEMTDVEKIIPSAVPQSDMALADQLRSLIFGTSGVDLENWSAQNDSQASSLTTMIKQAANLMVLQKYFDQWDYSLKILGERVLQIMLNNWDANKVSQILNEEASPHFYSRIFAKYQTQVQEELLTPTQQNLQAQQLMEINQMFGREVFPPSYVIEKMNVANKAKTMEFLQEQEQMVAAQQEQSTLIEQTFQEARLKELMASAAEKISLARERQSRSDSNVGLFEERLSELRKNDAISLREKMDAISKLLDAIQRYGELETALATAGIEQMDMQEEAENQREKQMALGQSSANEFVSKIMAG